MVDISELPDDSNGGDPNKKPEELVKKPKDEDRSSFPIPAELTEMCVALVRRCHYPMVTQVSNYFRRLIASSNLYETRSRLGLTELVLYASFRFPPEDIPRLYILNRNKFILLDSLPHVPLGSSVVTIGTDMYVIGGLVGQEPTSDAILIDCRTHKHRSLPSMRRARFRAAAGVIDGKIHVIGGCEERSSDSDWIEVFDVEKQIWSAVPGPYPYASLRGEFVTYVVMEDKFYIWDPSCYLVYEPKRRDRWIAWVGGGSPLSGVWKESCCVIDDMLYTVDPLCSTYGLPIVVYDPKTKTWKPVNGVAFGNRLPFNLKYDESKMTNFGGKLVILASNKNWFTSEYGGESVIWCVKIALERRQGSEIFGEVESVDYVLRDTKTPAIEFCRTLTF